MNVPRIISKISLPLLAGIGMAGIAYLLFFRSTDPILYADRDDSLITYSHVKNLFEYGFIGVSPSGERVEGYSNPLDFILFCFIYAGFGHQYHLYNLAKTYVSLVGIGAFLYMGAVGKPRVRLMAVWLGAGLLCLASLFMQWHGSGMEAAWSETMMTALFLILTYMAAERSVNPWYALPWFAASITRAESIFYTVPLLGLALLLAGFPRQKQICRQTLFLLFGAVGLYIALMAVRWVYFGYLLPNTAQAQGISLGKNVKDLLHGNKDYLRVSFDYARAMVVNNLGFLFIPAVLIAALFGASRQLRIAIGLGGALLLLTFCHPFLFHAARLGPTRYGAHLAPVMIALLVWAVSEVITRQQWRSFPAVQARFAVVVMLLGITLASALAAHQNMEVICCAPEQFYSERALYKDYQTQEGWKRPLLENADLGVLSTDKSLNHYDIAYLGSPAAALLSPSITLSGEYLFNFCRPHILENFGLWTCLRGYIQSDSRLPRWYDRVHRDSVGQCEAPGLGGIWLLKSLRKGSLSPERVFYDKFAAAIDAKKAEYLGDLVKAEIELVNQKSPTTYSAFYIVQTLYEFWPEIKALHRDAAILALTDGAPGLAPAFAYTWLTSGQNKYWARHMSAVVSMGYAHSRMGYGKALPKRADETIREALKLAEIMNPGYRIGAQGGYEIYANDTTLLLLTAADNPPSFEIGLFVSGKGPAGVKEVSFEPKYFAFRPGIGTIICYNLPAGLLDSIYIGQQTWDAKGVLTKIWSVEGPVYHPNRLALKTTP